MFEALTLKLTPHIMNKFNIQVLVFAVLTFFIHACSSSESATIQQEGVQTNESSQERVENIPEWYLNPPADDSEFLYSTGIATSTRMNLAQSRAELDAKSGLSSKMGEKIEALQKLFEEEIDVDTATNFSASFTAATRLITAQDLRGVSLNRQEYQTDAQGRYIAYVLYQLPVGLARDQLEQALSRDEEMYVRFKESQAFDELQRNLERLGLD